MLVVVAQPETVAEPETVAQPETVVEPEKVHETDHECVVHIAVPNSTPSCCSYIAV